MSKIFIQKQYSAILISLCLAVFIIPPTVSTNAWAEGTCSAVTVESVWNKDSSTDELNLWEIIREMLETRGVPGYNPTDYTYNGDLVDATWVDNAANQSNIQTWLDERLYFNMYATYAGYDQTLYLKNSSQEEILLVIDDSYEKNQIVPLAYNDRVIRTIDEGHRPWWFKNGPFPGGIYYATNPCGGQVVTFTFPIDAETTAYIVAWEDKPVGPTSDEDYQDLVIMFDATNNPELFTLASLNNYTVSGNTIRWSTTSEVNNVGFYVYYLDEDGNKVRVNSEIIAARGDVTEGASYEYVIENPIENATYYLEEEESNGNIKDFKKDIDDLFKNDATFAASAPISFWQQNDNMSTFITLQNVGNGSVNYGVTLKNISEDSTAAFNNGTIPVGGAVFLNTSDSLITNEGSGGLGYGTIEVSPDNSTVAWAAVYGDAGNTQTGFSIIINGGQAF